MATTRTPGITVLADGRRFIDKRYRGVRIGLRVGAVTQEQAEERLQIEIARVQCDLARKAHARPTFTNCAARYVAQSRGKRSIDVIKWHVTLLQSHVGNLEPRQVHDQTLEPFVRARLADGASATTINRSLEAVRTILNRAARVYRDADDRPWLEGMGPLITMLPETPRQPYPITSEPYCLGAAESLRFADRSFDLVVSVTALCFVDDARRAVREIPRVTR